MAKTKRINRVLFVPFLQKTKDLLALFLPFGEMRFLLGFSVLASFYVVSHGEAKIEEDSEIAKRAYVSMLFF